MLFKKVVLHILQCIIRPNFVCTYDVHISICFIYSSQEAYNTISQVLSRKYELDFSLVIDEKTHTLSTTYEYNYLEFLRSKNLNDIRIATTTLQISSTKHLYWTQLFSKGPRCII